MILAPATMAAESDPKEAARKCLEEVGLDPDSYRIGHTKARVDCTPVASRMHLICYMSSNTLLPLVTRSWTR